VSQLSRQWERLLNGTDPVLRLGRGVFRFLPRPPRCKLCLAPFAGPGRPLMRLIGKTPWERNPNVCRLCASWLQRKGAGGAEVELSLVFADVRGSTTLAERMSPQAYGELMNRFYVAATGVLIDHNAIIDKLVGDQVIGLFLPGYAGGDHARQAVAAGCGLLAATGHAAGGEPWLPLGVGVHTGVAFVGAVGSADTLTDFTALGDSVNTAARLASVARAGEALITEPTCAESGIRERGLERRSLELKGKSEPLSVVVVDAAFRVATDRGSVPLHAGS
jgi:adenylate cyclase